MAPTVEGFLAERVLACGEVSHQESVLPGDGRQDGLASVSRVPSTHPPVVGICEDSLTICISLDGDYTFRQL